MSQSRVINPIKRILIIALSGSIMMMCYKSPEFNQTILPDLLPSRITKNAEVMYKDSGEVIFKLFAPVVKEFEITDSAYTLFPEGLHVKFIKRGKTSETIYSNWGKWEKDQGFLTLIDKVQVINSQRDTLFTDTLYWSKENRIFYTQDTVNIKREDGSELWSFKGMESSEDFSNYTLYENQGDIILNNQDF